MNALQRYVAKQTLIEKLAEVTKKVPKNPTTKSLAARVVAGEPVRRLAGDILSLPGKLISRAEKAKKKSIALAHKRSPKAYYPGTTRLKRYFNADGSVKGGWTQIKKKPFPLNLTAFNPYSVKKGPNVSRDEDRAMRSLRR